MGLALLLLAANYSVHFFFGVRFRSAHAAILMNLSTYFLLCAGMALYRNNDRAFEALLARKSAERKIYIVIERSLDGSTLSISIL